MPSSGAIRFAINQKSNMLLHHEILLHEPFSAYGITDHRHLLWPSNEKRLRLMDSVHLAACRIHGTMDQICIYEFFRNQLGLPMEVAGEQGNPFRKLYCIETMTYGELIEKVKHTFGLGRIRHTRGDYTRKVNTVAIPWGGMALSLNSVYLQGLMELGKIDVMIAGETDSYGFHFCKEQDIYVIEAGHEVSENGGICEFSNQLARQFPALPVYFYEEPIIWECS
jgi:putative NIF3 family GTP cyclohydrolase 1 type 2